MKSIVLATLIILSVYIFKKVIDYISTYYDPIKITEKEKIIMIVFSVIFIDWLLIKFNIGLLFIFYYITILYLLITAFIDFKTQYIYTILNIFMACNSIAYLIYLYLNNQDVLVPLYAILVTSIICGASSILKIWNWGDTEVFIVISPIIATTSISHLYINFALAISLAGLTNLLISILKRFKRSHRQAFAPYIAAASILMIFFIN